MITLAQYSMDQILPFIGFDQKRLRLETADDVYMVKTGSTRLECLKRSQQCVRCKCNGTIWLLQSHVVNPPRVLMNCFIDNCPWCSLRPCRDAGGGGGNPHLNLYHKGRRGMILMTHDHRIPRSRGGSNGIENAQTLCTQCNNHKGCMMPEEYERLETHNQKLHDYARRNAEANLMDGRSIGS